MRYYAIKWGDQSRISTKVRTIADACLNCYGVVAESMQFINLGTTKAGVRRWVARPTDNWTFVPDSILTNLERQSGQAQNREGIMRLGTIWFINSANVGVGVGVGVDALAAAIKRGENVADLEIFTSEDEAMKAWRKMIAKRGLMDQYPTLRDDVAGILTGMLTAIAEYDCSEHVVMTALLAAARAWVRGSCPHHKPVSVVDVFRSEIKKQFPKR